VYTLAEETMLHALVGNLVLKRLKQ